MHALLFHCTQKYVAHFRLVLSLFFISTILLSCGNTPPEVTNEARELTIEEAVEATVAAQLREKAVEAAVRETEQAETSATATAKAQATANAEAAYQVTQEALAANYAATETALTATAAAERAMQLTATAETQASATAFANSVQLKMIRNWSIHRSNVSVAFSPDSQTLSTGGGQGDGTIRLWNVDDGQSQQILEPKDERTNGWQGVTSLAWHPNGQLIASGNENGYVWIHNVKDGSLVYRSDAKGYQVGSVAWSPDGTTLAVGDSSEAVTLLQGSNYSPVKSLDAVSEVVALAWSPDGTKLVSGTPSSFANIWRPSDGSLVQTIHKIGYDLTALAWSPDGKIIATNSDGVTKLFSSSDSEILTFSSDGEEHESLDKQSEQISAAVQFSPDGKLITDGTTIWQVNDGREIRPIVHPDAVAVHGVAWSPDGKYLAIGYVNGSVWLWEVVR